MKQHVPHPDPLILASMQKPDMVSHLLTGPDCGRIIQSVPQSQMALKARAGVPQRGSLPTPLHLAACCPPPPTVGLCLQNSETKQQKDKLNFEAKKGFEAKGKGVG